MGHGARPRRPITSRQHPAWRRPHCRWRVLKRTPRWYLASHSVEDRKEWLSAVVAYYYAGGMLSQRPGPAPGRDAITAAHQQPHGQAHPQLQPAAAAPEASAPAASTAASPSPSVGGRGGASAATSQPGTPSGARGSPSPAPAPSLRASMLDLAGAAVSQRRWWLVASSCVAGPACVLLLLCMCARV